MRHRLSIFLRRLKADLGHAFALSPERAFGEEETTLLERLAQRLVERRLGEPALLFLESLTPLNFLGSQLLHAVSPLFGLVLDPLELKRMATILERRESLTLLTQLIERKIGEERGKR